MPETESPALKNLFDASRFRRIAGDAAAVYPGFNRRRFLDLALRDLDDLSLLQRLRRVSDCLRATLPAAYPAALKILTRMAPRTEPGFTSLFLPDFVGQFGLDHFEISLDALRRFTPLGSSEFGIRPFLRGDLRRTLKVMEVWARDPDEHVRRLASEGCRPRLPWSFRLEALIRDPSPAAEILERLNADPSLYVRKSVANHLNDITKDHPDWVLERIRGWNAGDPHTAWIVRRALRTLVKAGDRRALAVIGAGGPARVRAIRFSVSPARLPLGGSLVLELACVSSAPKRQKIVIDYAIHYVKKSGASSAKVFKWKEVLLENGDAVSLAKRQVIKDFTTRKHHPGRHVVEVLLNGRAAARGSFVLERRTSGRSA